VLVTFSTHTLIKFFHGILLEHDICLVPTPGIRNTNYEPSKLVTNLQLPRDISVHQICISWEQNISVMQYNTLGKNVPYSVAENTFFPSKRYT
jgi:hypothetical protein